MESDASVPPEHRTVITTICALENIPRKKKKFDNFMQNQGQHISTTAAQAAWDYISGIFTANKAISDKQQQQQSSKKAAKASSKSAASVCLVWALLLCCSMRPVTGSYPAGLKTNF